MISDKFRLQLRQEAQLWQAEGIINTSQYELISDRYQFNELDIAARNRFVMILMGLGSILIGLGIITFVAANWQALSRESKAALLLSLFMMVNIVGFYLWRQPKGAQQRLGHGLLLLGAIILGANMGLMGQMFHGSSPVYELLLAWGVGVLAMAYSLRLSSLGLLSILLIGLGYWGFWWHFAQSGLSISSGIDEFSWSSQMGAHMPLLAALMFVPLAYWCRSSPIFGMAAIAVISSLEANLQPLSFRLFNLPTIQSTGWVLAIACALPPALLWAYDDSLWVYGELPWLAKLRKQSSFYAAFDSGSFQPIARNVALWCLGILFYFASSLRFWSLLSDLPTQEYTRLNWIPLLDAAILTGLAIINWLRLGWQVKNPRIRKEEIITTLAIAIFICIAALIPFWHISVMPIAMLATAIFSVLLFLLVAGLLREGLAEGNRSAFWGGMMLLTLRIMSWFLPSDTGLMLKSIIFVVCGFGVIGVGLWFERYVRTLQIKN